MPSSYDVSGGLVKLVNNKAGPVFDAWARLILVHKAGNKADSHTYTQAKPTAEELSFHCVAFSVFPTIFE